jgi:hypothetical protein
VYWIQKPTVIIHSAKKRKHQGIDLYQNRVVAEMKERKEINRRRRGEK